MFKLPHTALVNGKQPDMSTSSASHSGLTPGCGAVLRILMDKAAGRVSAELLCPYPPGVPVICPGEVMSQAVIDVCLQVQRSGGKVTGASDESLRSLSVICRTSV